MGNLKDNEQIKIASQPAEAEEKTSGDTDIGISLGKFKDVKSLLDAYNSLQSEFTKRCQRLKELEGQVETDKTTTAVRTETLEGSTEEPKGITDEEKSKILQDYLKDVLGQKQTAVVIDGAGVGVRTPAKKPKTISEAGVLAKEILEN